MPAEEENTFKVLGNQKMIVRYMNFNNRKSKLNPLFLVLRINTFSRLGTISKTLPAMLPSRHTAVFFLI